MTTTTSRTDLWWPYGPSVGRYTFLTSGADTHGELAQVLVRDSRGACTPLHSHDVDETFLVISGTLEIVVGDERIHAGPGDFVLGPRDVPHAFLVTSDSAEFLATFAGAGTPGPEGYGVEGFFREVAPPATDPKPEPCMPGEAFAERMGAYGIELAGPPPF